MKWPSGFTLLTFAGADPFPPPEPLAAAVSSFDFFPAASAMKRTWPGSNYKWQAHEQWDDRLSQHSFRAMLMPGKYADIAAHSRMNSFRHQKRLWICDRPGRANAGTFLANSQICVHFLNKLL